MSARLSSPFETSAARRGARGFTLVELMVAMSGGLFLSIAVFALSRDATRFYQQEGRIANATLTAVSGFERLSSEVARAGHLSTPNIQSDPGVCSRPAFPPALQSLRALVVGSSNVSGTEVAAAKLAPHSVQISGALNTPEVFMTRAVAVAEGGAWRVDLDLATPAAARLNLASPLAGAPATGLDDANQKILDSIFLTGTEKKGKLIRLRRNGLDQYAAVSAVKAENGSAYLTLATPATLIRLVKGGPQCGVDDTGKGMALSVIDVVRYDIRSMSGDATYEALRTASGSGSGVPFEDKRAELVRVELDSDLQEVDSTREIVGEYAVDLRVSAWRASSAIDPSLVRIDDPAVLTQNYGFTQLLRGVHLRVAVRSREADRDADVTGSGADANNRYRIDLGGDGKGPYARVRTLQSDVPLRNLESARW